MEKKILQGIKGSSINSPLNFAIKDSSRNPLSEQDPFNILRVLWCFPNSMSGPHLDNQKTACESHRHAAQKTVLRAEKWERQKVEMWGSWLVEFEVLGGVEGGWLVSCTSRGWITEATVTVGALGSILNLFFVFCFTHLFWAVWFKECAVMLFWGFLLLWLET